MTTLQQRPSWKGRQVRNLGCRRGAFPDANNFPLTPLSLNHFDNVHSLLHVFLRSRLFPGPCCMM